MQLRKPAKADNGRVLLTIRDRDGRGLKSESKTLYKSTPAEVMTAFEKFLLNMAGPDDAARAVPRPRRPQHA